MMQQRKYAKTPFVWPGLFVVALALVLFSGRKPGDVPGDGGTAGMREAAGSAGMRDAGKAIATSEAVGSAGMSGAGTSAPLIDWMSVEQATGKLQQEKRPVLIDLYTTWCGWCKQMDKKTYSNKRVAQYLQDKFYTVKVDAETHATIQWNGKAYSFNPQYRSNEFALYLTHGRLEFPTTIIIPPGEEPQAIPGYLEPKDLELLVKFFGEGAYHTQSFDAYQKSFKASW